MSEEGVTFGEMGRDGKLSNTRVIKRSDIGACPHTIMVPSHYRDNGSCKCDDPDEVAMMIREWGYTAADFEKGGQPTLSERREALRQRDLAAIGERISEAVNGARYATNAEMRAIDIKAIVGAVEAHAVEFQYEYHLGIEKEAKS